MLLILSVALYDEALVAQLNDAHRRIWSAVIAIRPPAPMMTYHESFLMRFPELLMYHQQHGNCGITLKYDATLYRWMRAQIGHIRQWKLKSQLSMYRKQNETRYMSALQAIGINWVPK
jgi:hypothetical protein